MSIIPAELKYATSHEWLKIYSDGTALVGITHHAQTSLGDITFVQGPKVGDSLAAGEPFGIVESVKAASDVYAPVSGIVLEVNPLLGASPQIVNQSPYGEGWILRLRLAADAGSESLLSAEDYAKYVC